MTHLRFGAFLAPHHPVREHPFHLFQRDLAFASHLDRQGFDELWVGEHHSSGWETIGSPEMFLAAASQITSRIKLATGVISLPYHHPFGFLYVPPERQPKGGRNGPKAVASRQAITST